MEVSQLQRISIQYFSQQSSSSGTRPQATMKRFERMVTHFTGAGNIFLDFFRKASSYRTILQKISCIVRKSPNLQALRDALTVLLHAGGGIRASGRVRLHDTKSRVQGNRSTINTVFIANKSTVEGRVSMPQTRSVRMVATRN
jgi:hypothetical protein